MSETPLPPGLRFTRAEDPGPFTLDGTRTWIVGTRDCAVVDPGPDLDAHVGAVVRLGGSARRATLVVTHGHADHAGAVARVLRDLEGAGVEVEVVGAGHPLARTLPEGAEVPTDAGALLPLPTPGHAPEHLSFRWPEASAVFVGDLLLGSGETTWVAGYPGCVADYLASLDRVEALGAELLLPAHGPPIADPAGALQRYRTHRLERLAQVREALAGRPGAAPAELVPLVYGERVPPGLERAATESVAAMVEHLTGGMGTERH